MKTGPRGGLYKRMLEGKFKGQEPAIPYALKKKNPREASRRKAIRTILRRQEHHETLKKFGAWVRELREYTKRNRKDFGKLIGVSEMTIRRWETALGTLPAQWRPKNKKGKRIQSNAERLDSLGETIEQLKKSKTPFEG
jgi:DNA-binding transcriptional regulator YiaG